MGFGEWRDRLELLEQRGRRHAEGQLRLRHRLDPILVAIGVSLVAVAMVTGGVLAYGQNAFGFLDRQAMAPLVDDRLVANIRGSESVAAGDYVAAAHVQASDELAVLRRGGLLHTLDLTTELWSDSAALAEQPGIYTPYSDMSLACPRSPMPEGACREPEELFAYSEGGGLVFGHGNQWRTIVGETLFTGLSGQPVANEQLMAAAVSGDRRWLVVTTRTEGLGLFDLVQRRWVAVPAELQQAMVGPSGVTPGVLGYADGEFLLGTANGLVTFMVDRAGQLQSTRRLSQPDGAILDIAVLDADTLVLGKTACAGGDCIGIYRYDSTRGLTKVVGESQLFPELSSASVARAIMSSDGGTLFVLGEAGAFAYERSSRTWTQLVDEPASAFLEAPAIDGIYFATPGHVRFLGRNGRLRNWDVESQRVISIAQGRDGEVLAQTADNATYALSSSTQLVTAGKPATEPLDAMRNGVVAFEQVVALGKETLLVHDPRSRSYQSTAVAGLGSRVLHANDVRLFGTPSYLWALSGQTVEVYRLDDGGQVSLVGNIDLPRQVRSVQTVGDGLILVDTDGAPSQLQVRGDALSLVPLTGTPLNGNGPTVDAILAGDRVMLAHGDAVEVYSLSNRGALAPIAMPVDEVISEIALTSNGLYLLGDEGSIVTPGSDVRLTGSVVPVPHSSDAISDALASGTTLFMAAAGNVAAYDLGTRRIDATFTTPSGQNHRLAGIAAGQPVSYDGSGAWLGEEPLAVASARVTSASLDGSTIVTTQLGARGPFIARFSASASGPTRPVCYFTNPGPSDVQIIDVAEFADGRSAALVGGAIWMRDEAHRRAVSFIISEAPMPAETKLHVLGDYLVAATETRALIMPVASFQFPDSCDVGTQDLREKVEPLQAMQLAVSKATDSIWTLGSDGALNVWRAGKTATSLPPQAEKLPDPALLQTGDIDAETLSFADATRLWRYNATARRWTSEQLIAEADGLTAVNIWQSGGDLLVTARDPQGNSWGGAAGTGDIRLQPLVQRQFPSLPFHPDDLRDVAALTTGEWAFLGRDQLALATKPTTASATFEPSIMLPDSRDDRTLWLQSGNIVILQGDAARPQVVHVIPQSPIAAGEKRSMLTFSPEPDETFATDDQGGIVRNLADGRVFYCGRQDGQIGIDDCEEVAEPAVRLAPADVSQAFAYDREHYLLRNSSGQLLLLDRSIRKLQAVPGNVEPLLAAMEAGENTNLLLDQSRRLSIFDWSGLSVSALADDIRMVTRETEFDLVQAGDTVIGYREGKTINVDQVYQYLAEAALDTSLFDRNLRDLDLMVDGASGRVAAAGYEDLVAVRAGQQPHFDDILSLPGSEALPSEIAQVFPLADGQWLLRAGDRIVRIGRATCTVETVETVETVGTVAEEADPAVLVGDDAQQPGVVEEAAAVQEQVQCLAVLAIHLLPGDLQQRGPHMQGVSRDDELLLDGNVWASINCDDAAPAYLDATLTGRPVARQCELEPKASREIVATLEPPAIREALDELLARIDPVTGLLDPTRIEQSRNDLAVMTGDIERWRMAGNVVRAQLDAVSTGSLNWSREQRRFEFMDETRQVFSVSPAEAMPDGRFAFTAPGTAAMLSPQDYLVANKHGVWNYSLGSPSPSTWMRAALPDESIGAGRGRVFFADGSSIGEGETGPSSTTTSHAFSIGRLDVQTDIVARSVDAAWSDGASTSNAFVGNGFVFDVRQDIATRGAEPWLMTPVGLVRADSLEFGAPPAVLDGAGITTRDDALYATSGQGNWRLLEPAGWRDVSNPYADRIAAVEGGVEWRFSGGRLDTVGLGGRSDLAVRQGLRFDTDVLRFAAAEGGRLVLALPDGTRQLAAFSAMATLPDVIDETPDGAVQLESRVLANGRREIVSIDAGGSVQALWTTSGYRSLTDVENPDRQRIAATLDWLRVRFDAGEPAVELALEDVGGGKSWSEIGWRAGDPMPFDRFTALYSDGPSLYAGSPVALQLLTVSGTNITAQRFIDMRTLDGAYDPVHRIGLPFQGDGTPVALGSSNCLRLGANALTQCSDLSSLDIEDLGGDGFWQWLHTDGGVGYFYRDASGGALTSLAPAPVRARFPHDRVDDYAACNDVWLQTWNGNVTQMSRGKLAGSLSVAVEPDNALTLLCRARATPPSDTEPTGLSAGIYLLGKQSWLWGRAGATAMPALDGALRARMDGLVPFEAGKLRAVNTTAERRLQFQYLRGTSWIPLVAADGRLSIDKRDGLVFAEGRTWAYTDSGMIALDPSGGIDPDGLMIAPVVGDESCRFDAAETADGQSSYLPLLPTGPATLVRCQDGQVLSGQLNAAAELGQFAPVDGTDPFEFRVVVATPALTVERIGRVAGRDGNLIFAWRDETNALAGGRFALDDIRKIARIEPGTIELVTAIGWVRQETSNLGHEGAVRPVNQAAAARAVVAVGTDIDLDRVDPQAKPAVRSLCIWSEPDGVGRWFPDGRLIDNQTCRELAGFDGSYAYRLAEDGLVMTGASENDGVLTRTLVAGRFSDHILSGRAVLTALNDQAVIAMAAGNQISFFDAASGAQRPGWLLSSDVSDLAVGPTGDLLVVSDDTLHGLAGEPSEVCPVFPQFNGVLETSKLALRGLHFRDSWAFARLQGKGVSFEVALNCMGSSTFITADIAHLSGRARFMTNQDKWGKPSPVLAVAAEDGGLVGLMQNGEVILVPSIDPPIFNRVVGDQFIVVTPKEIYTGTLDAVMSAVQRAVTR